MSTPLNVEVGLSSSEAFAQRLGDSGITQGDFIVGAGKQQGTQNTLYIVLGVVALGMIVSTLLFFWPRRR